MIQPPDPEERCRLELTLESLDAALLRFATVTQHKSQWRIAATLANKGITLVRLQRYEEGLAVCREVVRRYEGRSDSPTQVLVAGALLQQGIALGALGRGAEAAAVCDELLARFGDAGAGTDLAEVVAAGRSLRSPAQP